MKRLLAWVLAVSLCLFGCQASKPGKTDLYVLAAASLKESFTDIGTQFEKEHPNIQVVPVFAGSQDLALQIKQQAPCDVFASADLRQMKVAESSFRINAANVIQFAQNQLAVAASAHSKVKTFQDLAKPGVKVVLADSKVPAGAYGLLLLAKVSPQFQTAVLKNVASYETDVRSVLTKVELGEADCGIVYETDERVAKGIREIAVPAGAEVGSQYYIAALQGPNIALAKQFVSFVMSEKGQKTLEDRGFKVR
ncbi:MAG TPA: molybdate ABC transporter substrate-binding protein [Fimbriimonadaceae bacterium]|jgi:molybdate transport system substrate-binding protein